jgi:hypothetical protein
MWKRFQKISFHRFKIIAFEGRRRWFFVPCLARSANFGSHWRQKLELDKAEVFENHNVWTVRLLWEKSER